METITDTESLVSGNSQLGLKGRSHDIFQVEFHFNGEPNEVRKRLERAIREVLTPFALLGKGCMPVIEDMGGLPVLSINQLKGSVGDPRAISSVIGGIVNIGPNTFLMRSRKGYVWDPEKINVRDVNGRKSVIPLNERTQKHLKRGNGMIGAGTTSPKRLIRESVQGDRHKKRLQEPLLDTLTTQDIANAGEIYFTHLDGQSDSAKNLHREARREAIRRRLGQRWLSKAARAVEATDLPVANPIEQFILGKTVLRRDIHSTLGPFEVAPDCEIRLDDRVVQSIGALVSENVARFSRLVLPNTEGDPEAYGNCVRDENGDISEPFFQLDLAGLSDEIVKGFRGESEESLLEVLRSRIFEFEPSIAMYELIQKVGGNGRVSDMFREHLELLRQKSGRPIALLAPTEQKLQGMRESEFGKIGTTELSDEEIFKISGFDTLMGPGDFKRHLEQNNGECRFLLYIRPSDPVVKLVDPTQKVADPLFNSLRFRKLARQNAITINVDNPQWQVGDPRRLKDTKAVLPELGLAHGVRTISDIVDDSGSISQDLQKFLTAHNLSENSLLRVKPMQGVYGGYGQRIIRLNNAPDIRWLNEMLQLRGPYILQPEIEPLIVHDSESGKKFAAMDRLFFSMVTGKPIFMGGIRILIPTDTTEAQKGRLHGTDRMISVPIV